jgi:hypothetical protein
MNKKYHHHRHRAGRDKGGSDYWSNFSQLQRNIFVKQLKKWKFFFKG